MAKHRCSLVWGVDAVLSIDPMATDEIDKVVDDLLLKNGIADKGDTVIVTGGFPLTMRARANMIKVHKVGVPPDDY